MRRPTILSAMILVLTVGLWAASARSSEADATAAEQLLARSIAFHDPSGLWGRRTVEMTWTGTGSDGEERLRLDMTIADRGDRFTLKGHYRGTDLDYRVAGTDVRVRVDGQTEIDDRTRQKLVLNREGGLFWRNYFGFLAGFPMNLRDPGAHISPEPERTEFMGDAVDAVRVSYDPEVGTDTWTFYFRTDTAELVGCRFVKSDRPSSGEYLVFDETIEADGLRLPKRRRWYMNVDDRFLGEDVITHLAVAE